MILWRPTAGPAKACRLLSLALVGAAVLLDGGRASGAQQQPVFPTQADLVQVDAIVLDSKGNLVQGLTQDDFVVREEGLVVPIARFEAVTLRESAAAPAPTASFVSSNTVAPGHREPSRTFVIVFDDAQLSRATGERARAEVTKFLETGLRDDDEVTLVSTATNVWWTARLGVGRRDLLALVGKLEGQRKVDTSYSFVSDYEAMRLYLNRDNQVGAQVVRRFYENGVILDPPNADSAYSRAALDLGEGHPLVRVKAAEAYQNAKSRNVATLRALRRVADALAEGTGRKTVLLVSDGFVYDQTLPEFREVVAAMSRANGSIYFIDARGLPGTADFHSAEVGHATQERDVSTILGQAQLETEGAQSVAADTGGFTLSNPNDIAGGMERVAGESRAYYLLGYASPNSRKDGKFRRIKVEVSRPGLEVRARKGYYAQGGSNAGIKTQSGLSPVLRQAMDSPFAVGDIPLRLAAYVLGPTAGGNSAVLLAADVDPTSVAFEAVKGRSEATLESYLVVTARDTGERTTREKEIALSLPPEVRTRLNQTWLPIFRDLDLAPGGYQARLLLRDRRGNRIGTVRHEFEVLPTQGLRVSTPILTDSLQGDPKGGPPRPIPLARRSFASGANLAYLFEVYGAAGEAGTGTPRVTSRYEIQKAGGSGLVRSEPVLIEPGPQGQLSRQIAVSLKGAPAGDYEIVLTLEDQVANRKLVVRDPFSVSAP